MTLTRIITNKHVGLTCISSPLFTSVFTFRRVLVGFPTLFHLLTFPATFPFIYLLDFLILTLLLRLFFLHLANMFIFYFA
jgi:hypothetical protein